MQTRLTTAAAVTALTAMLAFVPAHANPNWDSVGEALGKKGSELPGGVYRVALLRSDLNVKLDGVAIKPPLGKSGGGGAVQTVDLDTAALDKALGHAGKANGGVYQFSIPRAESPTDGGMAVPTSMGTAIAINFQPTGGGKAAITGDFVLIASEVNPVLRALRDNGIEVTAIHNHMLDDQPRLFFMHFWANDEVGKLAQGLRAALEKVNLAKS